MTIRVFHVDTPEVGATAHLKHVAWHGQDALAIHTICVEPQGQGLFWSAILPRLHEEARACGCRVLLVDWIVNAGFCAALERRGWTIWPGALPSASLPVE